MPRTVDEILQHADELAARFENYEPDPADEQEPEAVTHMRQAVRERSEAERHVVAAIRSARAAGMSWSMIGTFVGTSGEAVRQRYGGNFENYWTFHLNNELRQVHQARYADTTIPTAA